jgi:hypothetical protein
MICVRPAGKDEKTAVVMSVTGGGKLQSLDGCAVAAFCFAINSGAAIITNTSSNDDGHVQHTSSNLVVH